MNEYNSNELIKKYPRLYRGVLNPNSCMQEGFCIGDGWYHLVDKLSADIERLAKNVSTEVDDEHWPEALQVKEKFGTLRFYLNCRLMTLWNDINQLITEAEAQSSTICENCGKLGTLRYDAWIRTMCDICESEYQSRFEKKIE